MNILGNIIKKEREKLNLSREELAQKLGVSYSAIAMYERGEREPNSSLLIKLCKIFNCSMDYLMGIIPIKNPKEELEKELYDFDLSEEEYYDAINCFMHDSKKIQSLAFTLFFTPEFSDKKLNREKQILVTIMKYVLIFVPDNIKVHSTQESIINKQEKEKYEEEFYTEFDKALNSSKKLLLSLNKSKIIHTNEPKIKDIYMHLAKEAQNLELEEEDINYIYNFYKKNKK